MIVPPSADESSAKMPSSPSLPGASSPLHGADTRRSRFTYRQLALLASYSPTNPLRVIAHIDLDAFYAQCEIVRLGIPEDKPLAVQQWYVLSAWFFHCLMARIMG